MLQFAALGLGKGVAALLKERSRVSPKKPTIWGLKRAFSEPGIALEITVLLSNTTCCLQQFIFKAIQKRLPKYNHEQIQELSISFPGSRHPDTWQDPGSYRWAQYNPCAQEQMWSYVYKRSHRPPAIGDWVQAASQEFMGVEKWVAQSSKLIPSLPPSLASARTFCRQGNTFNVQLQEITDGDIPLSRGGKRVLWDAPGKEVATSRVSESRATKALPEQTWFPLCEERFRWMKWASKRPLDKKKKKRKKNTPCLGGDKAWAVQSVSRSLQDHIKIHCSTRRNSSKPLFPPLASLRKPLFAMHIGLTLLPTAFPPPRLVDPLPPHQEGVSPPKRLYRAPTVPALVLSKFSASQLISSM